MLHPIQSLGSTRPIISKLIDELDIKEVTCPKIKKALVSSLKRFKVLPAVHNLQILFHIYLGLLELTRK